MSLKVSGMETVQLQLLVSMFQLTSSILFLKGQVYEAMDNRGLAADCYKQALQCDVHCYEAFEALVQHQMLSAQEGNMTIRNKN
jgi:anaphase-promoting complex subunit 6